MLASNIFALTKYVFMVCTSLNVISYSDVRTLLFRYKLLYLLNDEEEKLNSIPEILVNDVLKIEEILDTTVTEGDQPEGKYIDNILDYENCSINLV